MIQLAATVPSQGRLVLQSPRDVLTASEHLRAEAAAVLADVLDGVTGKQIDRASVPTCHKYAISRALNGGDSNPVYRLVSLFLLMKRCGMGRERALRLLEWLREVVDAVWPEPDGELEKELEADSKLDPADDHLRFMASKGCEESQRKLAYVKRRQIVQARMVIRAVRRKVGW